MAGSRVVRLLMGTLGATAMLVGSALVAGAAEPTKHQVVVGDSGDLFQVTNLSGSFAPGTYKLGFANNSAAPHVLVVVKGLPSDITTDEFRDLVDSVETGQEPPPPDSFVGAVFSKPGQDHQRQFDLSSPGTYGYFCPIRTPEPAPLGTGHYDVGFIGLFTVS